MTLAAGTLLLDAQGTPRDTDDAGEPLDGGLARALFDARVLAADAAGKLAHPDRMPASYSQGILAEVMSKEDARRMLAESRAEDLATYAIEAQATANAVVTYFTANAVITQTGAQAYAPNTEVVGQFSTPGAFAPTLVKAPNFGLTLAVSGGTYELK